MAQIHFTCFGPVTDLASIAGKPRILEPERGVEEEIKPQR